MLYLKRNGRAGAWATETGLEQLFEDLTREFGAPLVPHTREHELAPTLDLTENEKEWTVDVELPGIAGEDVAVSVTDNVLTIRGEKKFTACEGESCRRNERTYGKFVRTLQFPSDVDAKNIAATMRNGVLTVKVPKAEEARPKTIEVKVAP